MIKLRVQIEDVDPIELTVDDLYRIHEAVQQYGVNVLPPRLHTAYVPRAEQIAKVYACLTPRHRMLWPRYSRSPSSHPPDALGASSRYPTAAE